MVRLAERPSVIGSPQGDWQRSSKGTERSRKGTSEQVGGTIQYGGSTKNTSAPSRCQRRRQVLGCYFLAQKALLSCQPNYLLCFQNCPPASKCFNYNLSVCSKSLKYKNKLDVKLLPWLFTLKTLTLVMWRVNHSAFVGFNQLLRVLYIHFMATVIMLIKSFVGMRSTTN